ncbi:MAG: response regulator [Thiomargarita sp.]|nr:response regulator [Thiomargarita sp.]
MTSTTTILIVDDNDKNLRNLRSFIEEDFEGITVIEANTSLLALSLLLKHSVDFMFINIAMSHINGFEMAKIIKERPKTHNTPIIFMIAAEKFEEFQNTGFDIGTINYLMMPIDNTQLRNRIQSQLHLQHQNNDEPEKSQPDSMTDIVFETDASESLLEQEQIEYLNNTLVSSIHAIITYNDIVKQQSIEFGYNELLSNLDKIQSETQLLLSVVNQYLDPNISRSPFKLL